MTRAPFALAKPSRGFPRGAATLEDTALGWRFVNPRMEEMGHTDSLGQTAENVAREQNITREHQDRFALQSHVRAVRAAEEGAQRWLARACRRGFRHDESPRRDTSLERLASLEPVFAADGSVTAGNSSPLNDGAAVLASSPRTSQRPRPSLRKHGSSARPPPAWPRV